jgi:hypothetical protein
MVRSFQEALLRIDHYGAPKSPLFDLKVAENYTNPVVMSPLIRRFLDRPFGSRWRLVLRPGGFEG